MKTYYCQGKQHIILPKFQHVTFFLPYPSVLPVRHISIQAISTYKFCDNSLSIKIRGSFPIKKAFNHRIFTITPNEACYTFFYKKIKKIYFCQELHMFILNYIIEQDIEIPYVIFADEQNEKEIKDTFSSITEQFVQCFSKELLLSKFVY